MSRTRGLNFGGMSTGVFGSGALSAPEFESSMPASGASSTPASGAPSSSSGGSSIAVQKPASGGVGFTTQSSPFGISFQQQSQPAFGASSTPAFGASSTPVFGATSAPAFGSTGSAFGTSSTPAFGASSTPGFGCPPTNTFRSFSFGGQAPASSFWSHGFGQPYFRGQLPEGTRVTTYSPTDDYNNDASPTGKLTSISAMPAYRQKSLEELRWEDYKLGDKGNARFDYPPEIWKAANCYSAFGDAFVSTSLFRSATSGCPFGRPSSSAFGTSASTFGTQAQGTTSLFGTGFNNGSTQSSPLFQSPTPTPGQTSSPFEQTTQFHGQSTPPLRPFLPMPFKSAQPTQNTGGLSFSPQTASGGTSSFFGQDTSRQSIHDDRPILSQQSVTRPSGALPAKRPPPSRPFPSTQSTQNTGGFGFVESSDCTSSVFGQDNSTQQFRSQGPTLSQESITSPFGTLPATPVDDKPSPRRKSCLSNSQKRTAKKYPHKKVSFSDESLTTSTTPASQQRAGTRVTLYAPTIHGTNGGEIVSISAMCAYKEKSHEELRWEDYQLGDKGNIHYGICMNNIQPPNLFVPTSTFVFGTQAQGTSSSFGNTQPFPFFQSTTPTFGQTSWPFGHTVVVIHQHFHTNIKDSA